jgi:nucleotide-binding universal stress UspA family protein
METDDSSAVPALFTSRIPPPRKRVRFRNVVVATDLSVGGASAVTAGAEIARKTGARLSVISIVEPPRCPELILPVEPGIGKWLGSQQDWVRQMIENELEKAGIESALVHVSVGDPATLVAAFSRSLDSSLIVLGDHKYSTMERILGRPNGERIARNVTCPVMIAARGAEGPFRRILAAIDLSPTSWSVLEYAGHLARFEAGEVRVVFSQETPARRWRGFGFRDFLASRLTCRHRVEDLVAGSRLPAGTQSAVLHGPAGKALLNEAQEWKADLVVMGVRRRKVPSASRIGRTARFVLHHGDRSVTLVP